MANPIENALLRFKETYAWDKNLVADLEQEIAEARENSMRFVIAEKEQIKL
jgi:hypothetical protein